ncbi:hypothetical protein [Geotalea uraniireducens]|nr:hypothetical protein [Geotalea uraniireducens]
MAIPTIPIKDLRRELRASMGDRNKLIKLHSVLTEYINRTYGEEQEMLLKFRQEVKNAINCRLLDNW